ncbi:MAG: acyl-CoA thioesterase [Fimbriiglobus sp.]
MKPFSITRRVEFGDTDMAGIMHFANFFRFMEAAETAFLRSLGLSVSWEADGVRQGFPRVNATCDFARPARFEDELTIHVVVEKIGRKSVTYRFDFSHAGQPIATGRTTAVYCRATSDHRMESLELPETIRAKLTGTQE